MHIESFVWQDFHMKKLQNLLLVPYKVMYDLHIMGDDKICGAY